MLLIALALAAAVAVYFALANVRTAGPSGPPPANPDAAPTVTGTSTPSPTESPSEEPEAEVTDTDEATATTASEPVSTAQAGDPLEQAREALASDDAVTVAVLGDSTSNNRSEWVHLWAAGLAQDRPVQISHWNEASGTAYNDPDVLSQDGDGSEVTIWSGSQAGASVDYAVVLFDALVPAEPDLVILNYGHNNTIEDFTNQLDSLYSLLTDEFSGAPILMILQNPQVDDANAEVREAGEQWAQDAGVGVIDVAAAFAGSDADEDLLLDELHPNGAGQELWAQVVTDALD